MHDLKDCGEILDVFQKYGHNEIDSARTYGGGSSEAYLGQLGLGERGIVIDTKLSPSSGKYNHKPEVLRAAFFEALKALNTDKVSLPYAR